MCAALTDEIIKTTQSTKEFLLIPHNYPQGLPIDLSNNSEGNWKNCKKQEFLLLMSYNCVCSYQEGGFDLILSCPSSF